MSQEQPKSFNIHEWKTFFTNNSLEESVAYLYQYADDLVFYVGVYTDTLSSMEFMRSNLVNGFFQSLDPKAMRNTFGSGLIHDGKLVFAMMFSGGDMPELFKDSSLYDTYKWTKVDFEEFKKIMYYELFNNSNSFQQFICK